MMYADTPPSTPPALQSLMNAQLTPDMQSGLKHPFQDLHQQAVYGAAFGLGAQLGLKWQFQKIWDDLDGHGAYLDQVYNFQPLLLNEGKVLPPVIERADNTYQQSGDNEAQVTDTSYKILRPAKIVPVAPNWRNYFPSASTFVSTMSPDPALLPKTDKDKAVWKTGVQDGWNAGLAQANQMAEIDLNRLETDFVGMIRFKKLALQGMVSIPTLADGSLGIVVNGQSLAVNDTVFRLTGESAFQMPTKWRPLPSAENPPHPPPAPSPGAFQPPKNSYDLMSVISPPAAVQLIAYGDVKNAELYAAYIKTHYVALVGRHAVSVVSGAGDGGALLYRVDINGFASKVDATTWCAQAVGVGLTCFVK